MLPLGADVAQLVERFELCRRTVYDCLTRINNLDKEGAETSFNMFRSEMQSITKEIERLHRESKLYDTEYTTAASLPEVKK